MKWRPIKSAPKDGRTFLAVNKDTAAASYRVVYFDDEAEEPYIWHVEDAGKGFNHHRDFFTHWMELPAPPDGTEWRPIPGFPRYEASSKGHIRRAALPDGTPIFHALKPYQNRSSGHLKVSVYRNGKQFRKGVHQLVAIAFHGEPPPGKPFACHINGDAGDCRPENLYWGSKADNTADMIKHGRRRVDSALTITKVERRPQ